MAMDVSDGGSLQEDDGVAYRPSVVATVTLTLDLLTTITPLGKILLRTNCTVINVNPFFAFHIKNPFPGRFT